MNNPVIQFEFWKQTPGGRRLLQITHAIAAKYARRLKARGRRVSMKLIWEEVRDSLPFIKARLRGLGIEIRKVDGYYLNNNFTPYVARHILERHPDMVGLFETREVGRERA